jgi:hypothetical protein
MLNGDNEARADIFKRRVYEPREHPISEVDDRPENHVWNAHKVNLREEREPPCQAALAQAKRRVAATDGPPR